MPRRAKGTPIGRTRRNDGVSTRRWRCRPFDRQQAIQFLRKQGFVAIGDPSRNPLACAVDVIAIGPEGSFCIQIHSGRFATVTEDHWNALRNLRVRACRMIWLYSPISRVPQIVNIDFVGLEVEG